MNDPKAPERTALYRFYSEGETLLYVGITKRLGHRWNEHAKQQPWWPLVDTQTVKWHPSREAAKSAEDIAIATEDPVFNIVGSIRKGWVLDEVTGFYVAPKRVPRPRSRHYNDLPLMYQGDGLHWPYGRVVRRIKDAIAAGEYAPGSKLPTQYQLAKIDGVSKSTVQNALAVLRDEGLVYSVDRLGSFVSPPGDLPARTA